MMNIDHRQNQNEEFNSESDFSKTIFISRTVKLKKKFYSFVFVVKGRKIIFESNLF